MSHTYTRSVTVFDTADHADVAFVETVRSRVSLRVAPPIESDVLDGPGVRVMLTAGEARELAAALMLHADAAERGEVRS